MRAFRRHVDFLALQRFVAGESEAGESRNIESHLLDCGRCRARFEWLRTLPERLESASRPPLPEGMEERILARRAGGDRVILPTHGVEPTGRVRSSSRGFAGLPGAVRRSGAAAVAIAVLALVGGLLFLRAREAGALWSELIFDPRGPGPGDRVEVTYRPGPELAGQPWLVLRGRVTGPVDYAVTPPGPQRLTVLRRSGGSYRGSFTLDEGAVYAQMAVEDSVGAMVDDRGGRLWHLHVHRSGRPVAEALLAHSLLAPDWEDRHQTIERATRLYPGDPRLRAMRLAGELEVLPRMERDSAVAAEREVFRSLESRISAGGRLTAETMAGMVEYANEIGDTLVAREWTARLIERFPRHTETVWYRVPRPPEDRDEASLRGYLAELESLWRAAGPHPAIAPPAFWAARELADSLETLRWAEREADQPGWGHGEAGRVLELAEVPALRSVALGRLRQAIRVLDRSDDPDRPLDQTASQHERERRDEVRPLLVRLGELLLLEGERQAALDTLRVAASIGWSQSLHRRVAELELAAGDTLAAAMSQARASAPTFSRFEAGADEGLDLALGPELVGGEEWERMRQGARDEMHRSVLSRSVAKKLRVRPVYLVDSGGERHTLRELSHRAVVLVAFWEPSCAPAVRDLPRLRQVIYLVRAIGGEAIVITEEPPSERLSALLAEHRTALPLYHDLDRQARAAFQQYGSPDYFVLGFDGLIRFARTDLGDVVAEVNALMNEPRLTAASPKSGAPVLGAPRTSPVPATRRPSDPGY